MSLGLYLHIPYCFSKCRYCDFYSAPGQRGVPTQYVDALLRELARFAPEAPLHPDTIYFGGGTPSLLSPADAARLIAAAAPAPGAEITLEANPETVTEQTLCGFREAGVNRISFGVQSARDSQLKTLGRPHTARQARAAFAAARRAGFTNISGDIMLALPHYTQAEFDETLELIAEGGATHISAYLLKIEPDSAFGRHPPEGLPSPDEAADFYLYAVEHLEHHGYRQYEISNFAKPGYEGRHNLIYWDCGDYLGLGPAAHSCMGGRRFYYPADTEAFLNDKAAPVMDGGCGAEDYLILQLRLRKGLDLAAYKARYGKEFSTAQLAFVKNCVKSGYATFDGSTLALTPAGLIVQNSILAELLLEAAYVRSMTLLPRSGLASRSWVANRTARSPRRSFRSAAAFFMVSGSIPVKGSSSSRVSHPAQRARSRAARRFCPPESFRAGRASACSSYPNR